MNEQPLRPRPPRVGLALSGGGFRASFFHLGVLARLAELDLLRHIEVLSTVSGGSIIGALYYLHLRNLLMKTADSAITREDYIQLLSTLQTDFQHAVYKNFRTRMFGNLCKNLKLYREDYSLSNRISELYARFLYAPVVEAALKPTVPLSALKIFPQGSAEGFHPFQVDDAGTTPNDHRRNKVPQLILNTTTLNTGHAFQFTASWMGEPPNPPEQGDLDKNIRLRRAYLGDRDSLPDKYRHIPLATAVAASAAVPGLFHPLALTDLYPGMTPQLVDGGVHDNQGIEGLLNAGCTHLIVSDASGQMDDLPNPAIHPWSVLERSNSIALDPGRSL